MEALLAGLVQVTAWPTFGFLLIGVAFGSVIAFLPGINSIAGLVLLLPFVLTVKDPVHGLALLLGAHSVMTTGDSVFAILFSVPGHAGAQALVLDGYPMTLKGRAGVALGASFTASGLGGLIGALAFLAAIPLVVPITKTFGSPEFLVLALWGISMVGLLSGSSKLKGLAMAAFGLWLGTIRLDPQQGVARFTLGQPILLTGLSLVSVSLGLFAAPQAIELIQRGKLLTHALDDRSRPRMDYAQVREGIVSVLQNWTLLVRSSILGVFFGIIPGIGGSIIDWLVYGQTVAGARDRSKFGTGDVRGVIGPQSAENSKEGGQLIPTIAFGVPGGSGMAIILSAFLSLGISPGVSLVTTRIDLTMSMVWILVLANVIAASLFLGLTPFLARVTGINAGVLAVLIFTFSLLGAYLENGQVADILVFAVFAVVGSVMQAQGWPRPPLLLGFVLSPVLERYLFISLNTYGWSWLTHWSVIALFGLIAVSLYFTTIRQPRALVTAVAADKHPLEASAT